MSNINGKQQLKFKYYVSTSQPDQIWASMGRKGKLVEGFRLKNGQKIGVLELKLGQKRAKRQIEEKK